MDKHVEFKPSSFSQISHDIKTPITAILGMVNFLEKTSLTEQQKNYLKDIAESAHSLLGVDKKIAEIIKNKI